MLLHSTHVPTVDPTLLSTNPDVPLNSQPLTDALNCNVCQKTFYKRHQLRSTISHLISKFLLTCSALRQHEKTHNRDFECPYDSCTRACDSDSHLRKHIRERHASDFTRSYQCLEQSCRKYRHFFARKENFKRHCKTYEHYHGPNLNGG